MTTAIKPFFTEVDGEFRMSPTAMLITAASSGYCSPCESPAEGVARGKAFVHEMLVAAREFGFAQSDIAETVLAQPLPSRRAFELAQAACDCIPLNYMSVVFMRVQMAMDESK